MLPTLGENIVRVSSSRQQRHEFIHLTTSNEKIPPIKFLFNIEYVFRLLKSTFPNVWSSKYSSPVPGFLDLQSAFGSCSGACWTCCRGPLLVHGNYESSLFYFYVYITKKQCAHHNFVGQNYWILLAVSPVNAVSTQLFIMKSDSMVFSNYL